MNSTHNNRRSLFKHKFFHLEYAPVWVLIIGFLLRLPVYLIHTFGYWYDEIIFLSIAKLPFFQMFDTLLAEPKPPGAYVLFHYMPAENVLATRLALMTAAYVITGIALWYGYATRVIQHYKLHLGLALFLSSFSFLRLTSYVKPYEVAGVTFTIFFLLVALTVVKNRSTNASNRHLFLLHAIVFVTLFFNYIAYFFIMISLLAITGIVRKNKVAVGLLLLQLLAVGLYAAFFGYGQSQVALGRSIWTVGFINSIFFTIETHIFGHELLKKSIIADFAYGIFLWCIYKGIRGVRFSSEGRMKIGLLILTAAFIFIGYQLNLLRYYRQAYAVLLLLALFAGWGLYGIGRRVVAEAILILLFFVGLAAQAHEYRFIDTQNKRLTAALSSIIAEEQNVGVVSDMPLMAYAFKFQYFTAAPQYIPVNAYEGGELSIDHVTKDLLTTNRPVMEIKNRYEKIKGQLQQSNENKFLFLQYGALAPVYYFDPEQMILVVLSDSCKFAGFQSVDGVGIYTFDSCNFNDLPDKQAKQQMVTTGYIR